MKRILDQKNIPVYLLIAYSIKAAFLYQPLDSVIIVALSSLFGFKLWLDHIKKPDFSKEINEQIGELKEHYDNQILVLNGKLNSLNLLTNRQTQVNNKNESFGWGNGR